MAACLAGCIGHMALCHQQLSNPFHNSCHWLMIPAPLSGLRETSMFGMRLFLEAQVSPADLKSLPNLPGYTFPESLSRSVWLEAPPSIRVILYASVWLISAFIKLPLPRADTKNSRWFLFIFPGTKITIQDKTLGTWSTAWESSRKMGFPMTSPNLWRQGRGSWGVAQS